MMMHVARAEGESGRGLSVKVCVDVVKVNVDVDVELFFRRGRRARALFYGRDDCWLRNESADRRQDNQVSRERSTAK